jgi:hypothetical protein
MHPKSKIIVCLIFWSVLIQRVSAEPLSITGELNKLYDANRLEVFIEPWDIAHAAALTEERFIKFACDYTTQDPHQIGRVVEILKHSEIQIYTDTDYIKPDYKEGLLFHFEDGQIAKLFFSMAPENVDVFGTYSMPPTIVDFLPISANSSLFMRLFKWAEEHGHPVAYVVQRPKDNKAQQAPIRNTSLEEECKEFTTKFPKLK